MLDNRNKQVRKKQPSTSNKNTLTLDRWRFYLMWSVVLLCFLALVGRAFYVQIINKDFLQNKANANILRTEKVKDVIINDKYVEFRKAVAKGKKIEILDVDGKWKDTGMQNSNCAFIYPLEDYRIKGA